MATLQSLDIKRRSATTETPPNVRSSIEVAKLIDVSKCIGCKACQAACYEWNDLHEEVGINIGVYDNPHDLTDKTWTLMRFTEFDNKGNLEWLIRKDGCMHCEDPGCLKACPAPVYFHFVFPRRLAPERTERLFPRFIAPVLATYAALGIAAVHRPLNDVQAGGRKLGATAAAEIGTAVVVAGSFLLDFDRESMARSLRVSDEAFRDLVRRSLAEHMTTMRALLPALPSRERLKALFLHHIRATLTADPVEAEPSPAETEAIKAAASRHAEVAWTHRHGRKMVAGGFKIAEGVHLTEGERRTTGGLIRARLLENDGRIEALGLTGDMTCFPADGLERLARRLVGRALEPASALTGEVAAAISTLGLDLPGVGAGEIATAIQAAHVTS